MEERMLLENSSDIFKNIKKKPDDDPDLQLNACAHVTLNKGRGFQCDPNINQNQDQDQDPNLNTKIDIHTDISLDPSINIDPEKSTNDKSNIHNGLLPRIWGPHMWKSLHCISFGYPINPTPEQRDNYKIFFEKLGYVLPCKHCADSYNNMVSNSIIKLTDDIFQSRDTLTKWVYELHQMVNHKLCVDYAVSYEDIIVKYESFRAKCNPNLPGCVMPIEQKKLSYCNEYRVDCAVVPLTLAKCFENYAKELDVPDFENLTYYHTIFKRKNENKKMRELWDLRNKECFRMIQKMRKLGIPATNPDGLPTINELKLIARLSSTLNLDELITITNKLGCSLQKVYKFYV